jgi:hypothetical protein
LAHASALDAVSSRFGGLCFVGDSLLHQLAVTLTKAGVRGVLYKQAWLLVNALTLRPQTPEELAACDAANLTFTPADMNLSRLAMTYQHASKEDNLSACLPEFSKHPGWPKQSNFYRQHMRWTTFVRDECGSRGVLVLQTGHHWHGVDEHGEMYQDLVDGVLQYVARYVPKSMPVVYITSFRGTHDCGVFGSPGKLNEPGEDDHFQWMLPERNDWRWATTAATLKELRDRFFVLNVSGPGILRPDSHRPGECLHFCEPGLPTTWAELLLNLLNQISSKFAAE